MNKLIMILAVLICGHGAQAGSQCYEFDVQKYSPSLTQISIIMQTNLLTRGASAVVTAESKGRKVETSFQCLRGRKSTFCTQIDGGGDFSIVRDKISKITLSYLNLIIGSSTETTVKPGAEIDEDFAILDVVNSTDSEGDGGELNPVAISGHEVKCAKVKH